ncbi:PREDICTED: transcription factor bHLH51-like [Nelumbo nucifera]|uniref:BHLH domain-containing protein n=2 Tax=Nelumbo nucifera TaxID=4432 RepID=A0A822Y4W0_NELNU|nr:PREDICTED: transcription factor bHLH51-like [Nelumbo nucifera]DAD26266.1 TPA_asm: hypothetical protein HUJ06_027734 [Nelumbo nucifera]
MERCLYPGWPEEAHLLRYHALNGGPFLLPWLPPPPPLLPSQAFTSFPAHGFPPSSLFVEGMAEDRATAASKSHSQAEKRRRERINSHLTTLRKLIPRSDKMDKAALLGSVIDHVKDLKRKAVEVSQLFTVPTDVDEVIVDCDQSAESTTNTSSTTTTNSKDNHFIKASLCCDDRPELFTDLNQALNGLRLTTVRAEMATLGGRVISVLLLCTKDCEEGVCLNSLKQSLNVVLNRIASASGGSMNGRSSKRQRILLPSYYSQSYSDHHELCLV